MISLMHLKYFHDAALLGGVGAAATRHRVSPSAVSQAIKGLESHFGMTLLMHGKNRFELTGEGRALLERSFKLFTAADVLHEEMAWIKEQFAGQVVFGTQQSIAHYLLPSFIAHLQERFPAIQPSIRLGPTDVVKNWLEQRKVEFSLSVDNIASENFIAIPIYQGHFVLVASTSTAGRQDLKFITSGNTTRETMTFHREYETAFGKPPRIAMDIKSWGVVKRFAEMGMGIGLIPDYLLRFQESKTLRQIDLGLPMMPYQINAYHCGKRNQLTRLASTFLSELELFVKSM